MNEITKTKPVPVGCRTLLALFVCGAVLALLPHQLAAQTHEPLEQLSGAVNGRLSDGEKGRIGKSNYNVWVADSQRNQWFNETSSVTTFRFYPNAAPKDLFAKYKYVIYGSAYFDPNYNSKVAAVQKAIKALADNNVNPAVLQLMSFNVTGDPQTKTQAIKRITDAQHFFDPVTVIELGPADATPVGSVAQNMNGQNGFDSYTIGILHMIGHVLYERDNSEGYYQSGMTADTARFVSNYARTGRNEFVAEVFAGLMTGVIWRPDVMAEYNRQWRPRSPYK